MPAPLVHKAVMVLARERLREVSEAFRAKAASGRTLTNVEQRVYALAESAYRIVSGPPVPDTSLPGLPYIRPFGEGISQYAVMGTAGPDITGFSAILKPGQAWVFDTVHKGFPDVNREAVAAGTCDFALAFWNRVDGLLRSAYSGDTLERYLSYMRAYTLGHLVHVATDVIAHPFVADLEWHRETGSDKKITHEDGEASHEAFTARSVFLLPGTREGSHWDAWWPPFGELPPEFYQAYEQAFRDVYSDDRRTGSSPFEEHMERVSPPPLDADFVKDGYRTFRLGVMPMGYGYSIGHWYAMLLGISVPVAIAPMLAAAFPSLRALFLGGEPEGGSDRAWFMLGCFTVLCGCFISLYAGGWLMALSQEGIFAQSVCGLIFNSLSLVLAILGMATVGEEMPGWLRWLVFIVPGLITTGVYLILGFADMREDFWRRCAVGLVYSGGFVLIAAALGVCGLLMWGFRAALKAGGASEEVSSLVPFLVIGVGWLAAVLGCFQPLAAWLRDVRIPEQPRFPVQTPHHVRLFDDATLFSDPEQAGRNAGREPELADLFYPSGRRKLLQLWWEGEGEMWVHSDRFQLTFSFDEAQTQKQIVPAPLGPSTAAEYLAYLRATIHDAGDAVNQLNGCLAYEDEMDYDLPPGAAFSDHGDGEETLAKHDVEAPKPRKLKKEPADDGYFLYHAPKPAQAVRFGKTGPVADPFSQTEASIRSGEQTTGFACVREPNVSSGETIMEYSADLAALLCLGGASHVAAEATPPEKVYQVFRNWNLDRRRVNEWRMLVAGGAMSEKAGAPGGRDSLMPIAVEADWGTPMAGTPDALREAESTALRMGWIPLFREWFDMARRPTQDAAAEVRLNPANPTNRAMSRAMALLLDLADPAA